MKEVKALLRPHQLDHVIDALETSPTRPGVTVSDVKAWGHPEGGGAAQLAHRVKLEIVVADEDVESVLELIVEHGQTGRFGDGHIFVIGVEEAVRVRDGVRGEHGLSPEI